MFHKEERLQKPEFKEYGEYLGTYVSEHKLVKVHLFVKNGYVVPYALFKPPHHAFEDVDNWYINIEEITKAHGYQLSGLVYWWV